MLLPVGVKHPVGGTSMNDQKIAYAAAGSAVSLSGLAALVSSCCAAPWAVTLLGAASAAALARFSYLYPYLLAAAALSIGGVFWLAYRQRPVTGSTTFQTDRRLQLLAWALATAFVLLVLQTRSPVA